MIGAVLLRRRRRLEELDAAIAMRIAGIERRLNARGARRLVIVPLARGVRLAWSGRRGRPWRFTVDDGDRVIPLLGLSAEERAEAITSGALEAVVRAVQASSPPA